MKHHFVYVKNALRLEQAYEYLRDAEPRTPRFGLVHGFPGAGKTMAISVLSNDVGGCYVRATAAWTPRTMLRTILRRMGREDINGIQDQLDEITRLLTIGNKPLFVDEADYLFERRGLLDLLRDLHDMAGVPVVLVGMERISRKIGNRELLASRVSAEVKFDPTDIEDARKVADTLCEVAIAEDVLADLHGQSNGNIRRLKVGLSQVEAFGLRSGMDRVTLADWKRAERHYFLERGL